MSKRVLDVGNCNPDHSSLTRLLENHFDVEVFRTHGQQDTEQLLETNTFDLILVNRLMDRDGSSGLEIIQQIKKNWAPSTPVMMITNYAEHQNIAVSAGAEPGFGKAELHDSKTISKLQKILLKESHLTD